MTLHGGGGAQELPPWWRGQALGAHPDDGSATAPLPAPTVLIPGPPELPAAGRTGTPQAEASSQQAEAAAASPTAGPRAASAVPAAAPRWPPASDGPTKDPVVDGPPTVESNQPRRERVTSLPRRRIGRHLVGDGALDLLQVPSLGTGLVLGHGQSRQPVSLRLFRPKPTRVAVVGGLWFSQVLAFRALALGANVILFTGRPEVWHGFGYWATGQADRVTVLPSEYPVAIGRTSASSPALLMYDSYVLGAPVRPPLGPWQTQLTVLPQLTAYGFTTVQESDSIIVQRLDAEEARAAASVLHLNSETGSLLQVMSEDMLAILGGGVASYVWANPTSVERFQFGVARR